MFLEHVGITLFLFSPHTKLQWNGNCITIFTWLLLSSFSFIIEELYPVCFHKSERDISLKKAPCISLTDEEKSPDAAS